MIDVIVINRSSDTSDILLMMDCLSLGSNIHKIYYVADRCSAEFISTLFSFPESRMEVILADYEYVGRRTSSLRNIGYSRAKDDFDLINGILFIDGDRYFVEGSTDCIDENVVNNIPIDAIRKYADDFLFRMKDQIINFFYSACVYFPKEVCLKLEDNPYKGLMWNEEIEKIWGIEDLFVGNQLSILNIPYIYNRDIRINNAEMTDNKCEGDILKNANYLMKAIVDYRNHLACAISGRIK